jgi:DNA modification methylase
MPIKIVIEGTMSGPDNPPEERIGKYRVHPFGGNATDAFMKANPHFQKVDTDMTALTLIQPRQNTPTVDERIAALADRMSRRARENFEHGDGYSWDQATDYVTERAVLLSEDRTLTPQRLNQRIRSREGYVGPGSSFMSDAWRVYQTWPQVYSGTRINLPYEHYRRMAVSRVADKNSLRQWAEEKAVTQQQLRQRIGELVGDDVIRRGFRLQTTNHWRFPSNDGFDRTDFDGGIDRDVIANLLHYLTEPGDLVVDPMAGSGRLAATVSLPYFRNDWVNTDEADNGGARRIVMSDIAPGNDSILSADARKALPVTGANLIILDPPYWRIAKGKYEHGGDDIASWLSLLKAVLANCFKALQPEGWLALVLDDYLRSQEEQPLALLGAMAACGVGFVPHKTIYNNYTNACTTDAIGQWRAKKAHMMLSGMKIINVFKKPAFGRR